VSDFESDTGKPHPAGLSDFESDACGPPEELSVGGNRRSGHGAGQVSD